MAPHVLFSFLQAVTFLLRYGPSLYTLPSLSLKLLLLVKSLIPFPIHFNRIHLFSSSIIADLDSFEDQPVDSFSTGSLKVARPIPVGFPSTAGLTLRQSRGPNTPRFCLSGSLQQAIWSLSQSNVTTNS